MFPRWLGWVFLGFLAYVLYLGNFSGTSQPSTTAAGIIPVPTKQNYPVLADTIDKERWKRGINPGYVGPARWHEIKQGDGEGAQCGGTLTVKISGVPDKKEETRSITLGNAPYVVLNTALIGLKPGGVRAITAPPDQLYKSPKKVPQRMIDLTVERLPDKGTP